MSSFDRLFDQFGYATNQEKKLLKKIFENPGNYSREQIQDAYRSALRISEDDYMKNIGSDDDDYILDRNAYSAAQNAYNIGLQGLLIGAGTGQQQQQQKKEETPAPPQMTIENPYRDRADDELAKIDERVPGLADGNPDFSKIIEEVTADFAAEAEKREGTLRDALAAADARFANQTQGYLGQIQSLNDLVNSNASKYQENILGLQNSFRDAFAQQQGSFAQALGQQRAEATNQMGLLQNQFSTQFQQQRQAYDKMQSQYQTQLAGIQENLTRLQNKKPEIGFASSSFVNPGATNTSAASQPVRTGGTQSFKRKKTSPGSGVLKTIQSLNI